MEGTVVMASPLASPAPKPEPVPAAPPPAHGEVEGTVVMAAPAVPAYQAHYGPPSSGEVEGTLVMAAPTLPSKPPSPPPPPAPPAAAAPKPPAPPPPAAKPAPMPPPAPPMPPAAVLPPPIPQVVDATAAAGPAVKRGVPIALLAGGGGLVLLLGAIALGVALLRNRQPEASPTPAPTTLAAQPTPTAAPPSTTVAPVVVDGSLHVETQPAGATVTVDGVVRGVTPVDVAGLSIGTHQVKIEQKGFAVEEQSVEVTADAPAATINLALSKSGPAAGAADFTTNPPGAAVKLDGNPIGKTPLRNYKVRLGSHRVEYSADGYEPWSGNITVREGR
jgi:hypothetical protein